MSCFSNRNVKGFELIVFPGHQFDSFLGYIIKEPSIVSFQRLEDASGAISKRRNSVNPF